MSRESEVMETFQNTTDYQQNESNLYRMDFFNSPGLESNSSASDINGSRSSKRAGPGHVTGMH
jgi:hypothetical protein